MKKAILLILLMTTVAFSQEKTIETKTWNTQEIAISPLLNGTLFAPEKQTKKTNLVILIAGSGPTDRYGNQPSMQNNSLKLLAEALAQKGNAVFSYDKRIFAQMKAGTLDEKTLRFDDFIHDAQAVIEHFKSQKKYAQIIIAGHSEGSLIGMVAANANADAFISLAGAGRAIDEVLIDQIEKQAPMLKEEVRENLDLLKKGAPFELKNQMLASIFRESVQPYMISWMRYSPTIEIHKLTIPVLIINGTEDIQVEATEAEALHRALPSAQLKIIPNMNHIFKEIKGDILENKAAYSNPDLPIVPELVQIVNQFINSL